MLLSAWVPFDPAASRVSFDPLFPLPNRLGRILLMSGLIAGKEPHTIATLVSIKDQTAALTPSTV